MSTVIASHRHAPHRFGMRRSASVLAYLLTNLYSISAGWIFAFSCSTMFVVVQIRYTDCICDSFGVCLDNVI